MTEPVNAGGQAQADPSGTTVAAPAQVTASGGQTQTTGNGPGAVAEESFFDPRSIEGKPELQAAYRQMQGEFTKRMQKFRAQDQDLQLVQRFRANPYETMQQIAQQYGYRVLQGQGQENQIPADFNPQNWDDVVKFVRDQVKREELTPLVNEVRNLKKQNIEQQLDAQFPDWRTYEPDMLDTLGKHPTLVNDPATLYRMSVPASVLEARATKAAMDKLRSSTEAAQVSGATTTKQTSSAPKKFKSIAEAAAWAREDLQSRGIRPG